MGNAGREFKKWANHGEREFGRTGSRRANEGGGEDWALARNRQGSAANLIMWGKRDGI